MCSYVRVLVCEECALVGEGVSRVSTYTLACEAVSRASTHVLAHESMLCECTRVSVWERVARAHVCSRTQACVSGREVGRVGERVDAVHSDH